MRVLVAGATGAIGRPLVASLRAAGHVVLALARSDAAAAKVAEAGAGAVRADVFDPALDAAVAAAAPEVVVHQLTALPWRIDANRLDRDLGPTNRLRTEGTACLVRAALAAGARRVVAQAQAFPYAPGAGVASEDDPLYLEAPAAFRPMVDGLVSLERQVLAADGIVLRYGAFHGPGTAFASDGSWTDDARRGRLARLGPGEGRLSFVHVDDAAAATVLAIELAEPGMLHVVEDAPPTAREWLAELHAAVGRGPPWGVPRWVGRLVAGPYPDYLMNESRAASGARFRAATGWTPARSWRGSLGR